MYMEQVNGAAWLGIRGMWGVVGGEKWCVGVNGMGTGGMWEDVRRVWDRWDGLVEDRRDVESGSGERVVTVCRGV